MSVAWSGEAKRRGEKGGCSAFSVFVVFRVTKIEYDTGREMVGGTNRDVELHPRGASQQKEKKVDHNSPIHPPER